MPDLGAELRATIARWNEMAAEGVDRDFHRGETVVEVEGFGGPVADEPGRRKPNHVADRGRGPYYAALVAGGTLDTKGGPKATPDGEVVDDLDRPIRGLFGVGNCVAAPQARAYWAGGGTLGPMIGLAYRAAAGCHAQARARPVTRVRPQSGRAGRSAVKARRTKPALRPSRRSLSAARPSWRTAASTNPSGMRACEPKESKLNTRERMCSGTSSVISVVHAVAPSADPEASPDDAAIARGNEDGARRG